MELYPSLKPLKLIKPKPDKTIPIKGMIKVSSFNRDSFVKLFKKGK